MSKKTRRRNRNRLIAAGYIPTKPAHAPGPCKITKPDNRGLFVEGFHVASKEFLSTFAWRKVRMQALKLYGTACLCCGASPQTGVVVNVDHVKPRRLFPELALSLDNLQVLCGDCNHGKGNWDQTDWRPDEYEPEQVAHLRLVHKHG